MVRTKDGSDFVKNRRRGHWACVSSLANVAHGEAVFLTLAVEADRPRLCGLFLGRWKLMMVADFQTMRGLSVAYHLCEQ